jgi:hypothetical protein
MKIVRDNLYGLLNENMQQARSILAKMKIPEEDPRFLEIRELLGVATEEYLKRKYGPKEGEIKYRTQRGQIGYIGKFTKWIFQDREPWTKLVEVFEMLKNHPTQVPPIDTFKTLEDLFDFLQGSGISTKVNQVINSIPSNARKHANDKLKKLIELNIIYAEQLMDFYSKKGGRFAHHPEDLYKDTHSLIENLSGKFNLDAIKKKIKETKSSVKIMLESPDILVIQPLDYEASCALGSKSWCISYSKNYWDSYADIFSNQYFIYDFTKSMDDKKSMIGVTVNPDGSYKAAHFKDDSTAPHDYIKDL